MKFLDGAMKRLYFRRPKQPAGSGLTTPNPSPPTPTIKPRWSVPPPPPACTPLPSPRSIEEARAPPIGSTKPPAPETLQLANKRRRAWFNIDISSASSRQKDAVAAYVNATGTDFPIRRTNFTGFPGMLDQKLAAAERRWRYKKCRQVRAAQRFPAPGPKIRGFTYAVTLVKASWIRPDLDPAIIVKVRKEVQRQAKRISMDAVVTGMIDICPLDDRKSGVRGWSHHVHLTVRVVTPNYDAGKQAIKKAFPFREDDAGGVPRPIDIRHAYYPRGWDHYSDKLLQWGGIRQRVVRVDPATGRRQKASKPPLTVQQSAEWAVFISKIQPSDLMIWVGYRRYGNRLVKIGCNPSNE
jgi:hypothetical protein